MRRTLPPEPAVSAVVVRIADGIAAGIVAGLCLSANAAAGAVAGEALPNEATAKDAPALSLREGFGELSRAVAAKVLPSVVTLHVARSAEVTSGLPEELHRFFNQPFREDPPPGLERFLRGYYGQARRGPLALGSGVILDEEGLVVTNAHIVFGAVAVTAGLHTGERVGAKLLGVDARSDIAALRLLGGGPFRPVERAEARSLRAGDRVVAVGSPLGLEGTVSAGVVSHPGRYLPSEIDYLIPGARASGIYYGRLIQVDAAISRGSSGGALVDMRGRIVGVTVLLYGSADIGFGFAIPVGKLDRVLPSLAEGKEVEQGYLGVAPKTLEPELAEALGLVGRRGVVVDFVEDGGPASRAGIASGEVILSMDGRSTAHEGELIDGVGDAGAGAEVTFEVASPGGDTREVKATLARRRPSRLGERVRPVDGEERGLWRGVRFGDFQGEAQGGAKRGVKGGARGEVRIVRVASGSPGARSGLRPGMRVNEAVIAGERVEVESVAALKKALDRARGPVAFRTDAEGYLAVPEE